MRLFPQRDVVFHHLGRYLFCPSNAVCGLITRYYDSYLLMNRSESSVLKLVHLSMSLIRTLHAHAEGTPLLPEVNTEEPIVAPRPARSKVVLVTSLNS